MNTLNEQDATDIAIRITDALVLRGLVPDCTDTEDETEFEVQDAIKAILLKSLNA
jgi:hypothetical protein